MLSCGSRRRARRTAARGAAAQEQRTFLDVTINQVAKGDTLVVLRESDALVGAAWLAGAGLTNFAGRREAVDGEEMVSLASLAPGVTFMFNERDLRVDVTATPDMLGTLVRDLQQGRPANLVYRHDTPGFLNYSLSAGSAGESDFSSEAGFSVRGALAYSTLTPPAAPSSAASPTSRLMTGRASAAGSSATASCPPARWAATPSSAASP